MAQKHVFSVLMALPLQIYWIGRQRQCLQETAPEKFVLNPGMSAASTIRRRDIMNHLGRMSKIFRTTFLTAFHLLISYARQSTNQNELQHFFVIF